MDSVSSVAALDIWVWFGLEGEDGVEVVGVRASSSQESGGGAEVDVGFIERDLRFGGRSVMMEQRLVWCIIELIRCIAFTMARNGAGKRGRSRAEDLPEDF